MVRCLIVTYGCSLEMLKRCLDSVAENLGERDGITLVDNGTPASVIAGIKSAFPLADVVSMERNAGFAAAVNFGMESIADPYVLLLNPDTILKPGSLKLMRQALESAGEDVAGVAPKMMSSSHPGVIDAIGTVMPPDGASFNRGIGQCDLGQYDRSEEVFGACFGAALLRRDLFRPDAVGGLYERYFLYFDDSDWCMRARSQGYKFLTAPEAVVDHLHSGTIRDESLAFKYKLVELNTLRLVVRNFDSLGRTLNIVTSRCARLVARTIIRRRFIGANLSTLGTFLIELPGLIRERRALKRFRIIPDSRIFRMASGEDAYFDTVAYQPDRCLDSLIDTYLQLLKQRKDPDYGRVLAILYRCRRQADAGSEPVLDQGETDLLERQTPCVKELLKRAGVALPG